MGRTILVTGSSGRLGAPLVRSLARDHAVVQLDLHGPPTPEQAGLGRALTGTFTDPALVAQAMDGVDTVIHCGAIPGTRKPYETLIETNVLGTFVVLEAAGNRAEVEQFIYVSSIMMHGLCTRPFDEHMPDYLPVDEAHPSKAVDYYPCSKAQAEYWCRKYVQRFRKPVVVIRPPYIVAPDQEPAFRAVPPHDVPHLYEYIGAGDLIDGITRAMDYHPERGFDRFLLHAADQRSTMPSIEIAEKWFPGVPHDRDKLSACDGFGALVDWSHAADKLDWVPRYRCRR